MPCAGTGNEWGLSAVALVQDVRCVVPGEIAWGGGGRGLRVLITGGTGFIGSRLTHAALERGWTVYVLTRRPDTPQARAVALAGARLLLGDVADRDSLARALHGAR